MARFPGDRSDVVRPVGDGRQVIAAQEWPQVFTRGIGEMVPGDVCDDPVPLGSPGACLGVGQEQQKSGRGCQPASKTDEGHVLMIALGCGFFLLLFAHYGPPDVYGSGTVPFVIPSEAEGSAVLQVRPGNIFDRVLMWVGGESVPRLRRSDIVGESDAPALPGWADVWRSALRASKPTPLPRKTFPGRVRRTADPSATLGMTKCEAVLPSKFVFVENSGCVRCVRKEPHLQSEKVQSKNTPSMDHEQHSPACVRGRRRTGSG